MKLTCLATVALAILAAACARAHEPSLAELGRTLPASIEVVVSIRDASSQRTDAAGKSAAAMLAEFGDFGGTTEAWIELSSLLELDPADAFDELLGTRVVIVGSAFQDPEDRQWAILTEISAKTELSLRLRLKPAPRSVQNGLPIFAFEQGRIELVTVPHGNGSVALIAPEASRALLESLLPTIRHTPQANSLAKDPVFAKLAPANDADVAMYLRLGPDRAFAFAADARAGGWDATASLSQPLVRDWLMLPDGSERTSLPALDIIDDGALLAVAGRSPALLRFLLGSLVDGAFDADAPSLIAATTNRTSGTPALILAQPLERSIPTTEIDRAIAADLTPKQPDRSIFRRTADGQAAGLAGKYPSAIRLQRVDASLLGRMNQILGDQPRLAWLHHRGPRPWLITRLDGIGDESMLLELASALDRRRIQPSDRVPITAGWIRPRELLGIVGQLPMPPQVEPLRRVERFGWSLVPQPNGTVTGSIRLDMALP